MKLRDETQRKCINKGDSIETAFYTPLETAAYLGVPVSQVYALVKTKGFPVKRIGRHYRIHKAGLEQWSNDFSDL